MKRKRERSAAEMTTNTFRIRSQRAFCTILCGTSKKKTCSNLFWVDRIYIYIHSAFSSCISCLLAWTSCWVMYAHCAFARPVWSDFWRPCLISRMCVYFYTYSSAADFSPIDVIIDSDGFIIPAKADEEFQWLCNLGNRRSGWEGGRAKGGVRRSEGAASTPEETSTRLGRRDFYHFTEQKRRRGECQLLCCSSFTSKLHI